MASLIPPDDRMFAYRRDKDGVLLRIIVYSRTQEVVILPLPHTKETIPKTPPTKLSFGNSASPIYSVTLLDIIGGYFSPSAPCSHGRTLQE